jgi:PAS domain S-box-containing protein/putative nucleotidyltransferase with HDIG domain
MIRKKKGDKQGAGSQGGPGAERVPEFGPDQPATVDIQDRDKILRELHAHQAELKVRNDELLVAQAQLEASQEKYFDLYHIAPVGYFSINEKGIILEANITGANLFGVVPPDLYSRQFNGLIYKDDLDIYNLHRLQLFTTLLPQVCQMRMVRKDDSLFWARIEASMSRNSQTGKQMCNMVMSDITLQKQSEEQRNIALEKYRILFESFPLGITITDADGNIVEANKESENLLGLKRVEHIGRKYDGPEWQFIRPDGTIMPSSEFASVRAMKEKRRIAHQEAGLIESDGSVKWIEVTAEPIPLDHYGVAITYGEVTDRKNIEEALQKSEQNYHLLADYNKQLNGIAIAFNEAADMQDLFNMITESFRLLTGSVAATYAVYKRETSVLQAVSLSIDPTYGSKIADILGPGLFEMQMPVNGEAREQMSTHPIGRLKDLHELSLGVISQDISDLVMETLGCKQIVALAVIDGAEIVGTCVAYLPANAPVVPDYALKTYAQMVGQAIRRKQSEELQASTSNFLNNIIENSPHAMWISDSTGTLIKLNQACRELLNITDDEVVGKYNILQDNIVEEQGFMPLVHQVFENGATAKFTLKYNSNQLNKLRLARKAFVVLEVTISAIKDAAGKITNAVIQHVDITTRRQEEDKRELSLQIMGLLNKPGDQQGLIRDILLLIKDFIGCEAVGIRLREGDDYPYYQSQGFVSGHVEMESRLCVYDDRGKVITDFKGDPVLECMCGNIIRGRFDPALPFFTAGGSFWTNNTTQLLASTSEEDRKAHTRNNCNAEGYESVALIPLRGEGENIGLLQLNDTRSGLFSLDIINYYEGIANSIGIVLARKKAEVTLRNKQIMLLRTEGIAKIGSWEWDVASDKVTWSDELFSIFHRDPQEGAPSFAGHPALYQPEDMERLSRAVEIAIADGTPYELELHAIRQDGVTRICVARGFVEMSENGRPVHLFGSLQDITDRKKVEQALIDSEEKYRNLFDNAMEAIFVAREGRIIFFNPGSVSLTGYSAEELVERPFTDFIHPDDKGMVIDRHIKRLKGETIPQRYEFRIIQKNGGVRWVELSAALMTWEGQPATLNFLEDITDRKLAQTSLADSEAKYRLLADNTADGVWLLDMDLKLLYCSPASSKQSGFTVDEIKAMSMEQYFTPESLEAVTKAFLEEIPRVMSNPGYNKVLTLELEFNKKDGTTFWAETKFSIIRDEQGKPISIIGQARDISERKQVEKQVRENELLYRNLVETSPDGIGLMDLDGNIIMYNKQALQIFGFDVTEDLIGRNIIDLVMPQHYEASLKNAEKLEQSQMIRNWEVVSHKKDGRPFWVDISTSMLFDEGGKAQSIMAVFRDINGRKLTEEKLEKSYEDLKKTIDEAVIAMSRVVEMKDPYTAGHQMRVALLATAIAREMKMPEEQVEYLNMAATIHDIGKIYVPSDILSKPGKLGPIEFEMIKTHARGAYDILKDIGFKGPVAQIAYQHHERLNGSGYPQKLKDSEILLEARILAVADVVEAMASHRPYRPSLGIDKALQEISANKGILFDPLAVDACLDLFMSGRFNFDQSGGL